MNELLRLLDNGYGVAIYRNSQGTYTAVATKEDLSPLTELDVVRTDEETPEAVAKKLVEKVMGTGDYR